MKLILCALGLVFFGGHALAAESASAPIDFDKARQLFQRQNAGEPLSADEKDYLERAKEARSRAGNQPAANQRKAPDHLTPLSDMTAAEHYEGEDGGLYGNGSNQPPEAHLKAARAQLSRIRPLNAEGKPDPSGTIGFISISMSNATMEFGVFKRNADAAPQKSPKVTLVDCAQGGQTMARWATPDAQPWVEAKRRLEKANVTPRQVQVAWIKLANAGPSGSLQEHGKRLEEDTVAVLHNARALFPNLRIAYLASRIYAGYAKSQLNPEPYAYEGAFPVRWLIQRQAKGDPELAEAKSPLLLWGPYLWADGAKGRKSDSLVWEPTDFGPDGTHPSPAGQEKVSKLLLDFFSNDPLAKPWFAKP